MFAKGIIAKLEENSRWKRLKVLGSSNLVRASVLMPAFGYMLLLNENVHQYLTIKFDGWLLHYLPNVWRIWLLFYGTFFLAAGALIYSAFCPVEVKQYDTSFEMADIQALHWINMGEQSLLQKAVLQQVSARNEWEKKLFKPPTLYNGDMSNLSDLRGTVSRFLITQWTIKNLERRELRITTLCLFWIGLGLIALPSFFTLVQVSLLGLTRLFS